MIWGFRTYRHRRDERISRQRMVRDGGEYWEEQGLMENIYKKKVGLPDLERKQEKIKAAEFHRVRPDRAGPDVKWPNLPNFVGWKKELGRCHLSACSLPRSRPRYIGRVIEVQPWNNYTAD